MKIPKQVVETVDVKYVQVHAKVRDSGSYVLYDENHKEIACLDDYVPRFFPEDHMGDYLILNIDLETGQILNWKKPSPECVAETFGLLVVDNE